MSIVAETATVAWGYTMADLERIAWGAVKRHWRARVLDSEERHDVAWHGVVVSLFSSATYPAIRQLFLAAMEALDDAVSDERRHHGRSPDGWGQAPNFTKFWGPVMQTRTDGFTDHLVEVLALPDALRVLTPEQYEAIITLAAHDNNIRAAAAAVGMKYHGFYHRVDAARRKIKAVWFEGETPIQRGNGGTTCRAGHSREQFGFQRDSGVWECKVCKRNSERRRNAGASARVRRGESKWQEELSAAIA